MADEFCNKCKTEIMNDKCICDALKNVGMNKEDHPRGLFPEEREEWHKLCERLFELYEKMPALTNRKIISGGKEMHGEIILLLFKGNKDDAFKVKKLLDFGE